MSESMQNSFEMFRQQIIRAMHVMAADPQATDHAMAGALRSVGHDELEAEVLVAFLPLGLARAIISRLPDAASYKLSSRLHF